jgi:hypothetical protein
MKRWNKIKKQQQIAHPSAIPRAAPASWSGTPGEISQRRTYRIRSRWSRRSGRGESVWVKKMRLKRENEYTVYIL